MPDSFYFRTYAGLLTPEHRKQIGSALWEFLWCINRTSKEKIDNNGAVWGLVLGGKPISYQEVCEEIGGSKSTIRRNFERLENYHYIKMKRTAYGHIIYVRKSKKFSESAEYSTVVPDMAQGYQKRHSRAKNGNSNKDNTSDITHDNTSDIKNNNATNAREGDSDGVPTTDSLRSDHQPISVDAEISHTPEPLKVFIDKFIELRAYGFDASTKDETAAQEILDVVPLDKAIKLLEQRFETYKPKHPRQRINSLDYCAGYILDHYLGKAETKESKRANQRVAPMPKVMQDEKHEPSEDKEREAYLKNFLNNLGGGGEA